MQQVLIAVVKGPDAGNRVLLTKDFLLIGRDQSQCDLVLSDLDVSRVHAKVTLGSEGAVYFEDAGSTNGTYLGSEKIIKPVLVKPGEEIRLGTATILAIVPQQSIIDNSAPDAIISIGRDVSNDLVINDPLVSRSHARIERRGDSFSLVDLRSANGTYLMGEKIKGKVALFPNSWLMFGGKKYYFNGSSVVSEDGGCTIGFTIEEIGRLKEDTVSQYNLASFTSKLINRLRPIQQKALLFSLLGGILIIFTVFALQILNPSSQSPVPSDDQKVLLSTFGAPDHFQILFYYDDFKKESVRLESWAYSQLSYSFIFKNGVYKQGEKVYIGSAGPNAYGFLPTRFTASTTAKQVEKWFNEKPLIVSDSRPGVKIYNYGDGVMLFQFDRHNKLKGVLFNPSAERR